MIINQRSQNKAQGSLVGPVPYCTSYTYVAEKAKTEKYKALCTQRGLTFVPVIFTTTGGIGEQFQRQLWHPHWKRVEEEDLELGIGPWASRRRKQTWLARFGVEIAKCNTRMVSRSQHIVD